MQHVTRNYINHTHFICGKMPRINLVYFLFSCFVYFICCFNGCSGALTTQKTLFVDCINGIDNSSCGITLLLPCKTLHFATETRAGSMNSSHLTKTIAPGVCEEKHVLLFYCHKNTTTTTWAFITTNKKVFLVSG